MSQIIQLLFEKKCQIKLFSRFSQSLNYYKMKLNAPTNF